MSTSGSTKEAVAFILDTSSPSMNRPLPFPPSDRTNMNTNTSTNRATISRLDYVKREVEEMIGELMIRSKANEVGVLVLGPGDGSTTLDGDDDEGKRKGRDPMLTDLSCPIRRPSVELLRSIRRIRAAERPNPDHEHRTNFDFCDGIVRAARSIQERTHARRFERKIILFTDAVRKIRFDDDELRDAVNDLRDMGCHVTVVGLGFERSVGFDEPADVESRRDGDEHDEKYENDSSDAAVSSSSGGMEYESNVRNENEKFLTSLVEWTGGEVIAISSSTTLPKKRRIARSSRASEITFTIAPGLSVPARISLHTTRADLPTRKRVATTTTTTTTTTTVGKNDETATNSLGEIMTTPTTASTRFYLDPTDPSSEVPLPDRATAYLYGSDLVPVCRFEREGLTKRSPPMISILGYISMGSMPTTALMGPTRIVTGGGGGSRRARVAICALAGGMFRLGQYAVCTLVNGRDSDPVMGILAPHEKKELGGGGNGNREDGDGGGIRKHLLFVPFPFADDFRNLAMPPLDDLTEEDDGCIKCFDDLIDSFSLSEDTLASERIGNPVIRTFRNTLVRRAVDPTFDGILSTGGGVCVVSAEEEGDSKGRGRKNGYEYECDVMSTPPGMLRDGREVLKNLRTELSLRVTEEGTGVRRERKGKEFWNDF